MSRIVPLQDALQRTRPFRSPAQEAALALLRASDALRRRLGEVVGEAGITLQQYNVLRILRGAGREGLPTLAVGERMIERTPGITRLLDRLASEGLVERTRCAEDRRRVWARISADGLDVLERLDGPVAQAEDALFAGVASGELTSVVRTLERVWSRLEAEEGEA
jgi:MarR family transcriptional regulator, organic hydroperoxide resistance regulator